MPFAWLFACFKTIRVAEACLLKVLVGSFYILLCCQDKQVVPIFYPVTPRTGNYVPSKVLETCLCYKHLMHESHNTLMSVAACQELLNLQLWKLRKYIWYFL